MFHKTSHPLLWIRPQTQTQTACALVHRQVPPPPTPTQQHSLVRPVLGGVSYGPGLVLVCLKALHDRHDLLTSIRAGVEGRIVLPGPQRPGHTHRQAGAAAQLNGFSGQRTATAHQEVTLGMGGVIPFSGRDTAAAPA